MTMVKRQSAKSKHKQKLSKQYTEHWRLSNMNHRHKRLLRINRKKCFLVQKTINKVVYLLGFSFIPGEITFVCKDILWYKDTYSQRDIISIFKSYWRFKVSFVTNDIWYVYKLHLVIVMAELLHFDICLHRVLRKQFQISVEALRSTPCISICASSVIVLCWPTIVFPYTQ